MENSTSTTVMLIPDAAYIAARPKTKNHHLTVAYFGKDLPPAQVARLRNATNTIKRSLTGPIQAKANGIGIFDAGNDGYAVVDLIDGIGTLKVRSLYENLFGSSQGSYATNQLRIDYTHGFTPHITREYLVKEDEFYAEIGGDMIDSIEFQFVALGVWSGNERYEITL